MRFHPFLFISFLTVISCIMACTTNQKAIVEPIEIISPTVDFPASWTGIYADTLAIYTAEGLRQKLPMELHILPIDSSENYTWTIIYGEDREAGKRAYELIEIDAEKGIYAVDEKNSIIMEGYFIHNAYYQQFEVQGTMLMTITERINENELRWTIIHGNSEPLSTTGGQTVDGEEIPPVKAFPINGIQQAHLKRQ